MNAKQRKKAEKIYDVLTRQCFVDFYGQVDIADPAVMSRHITADEGCMTKDEILEEIASLFKRVIGE